MPLAPDTEVGKVKQIIAVNKRYWVQRNLKFRDWFRLLILIDELATKGMETYVSNEPQTFFNMAHFLTTTGELSHLIPVANDSPIEMDKRAKVHRGCEAMWVQVDRGRREGGMSPFIDELAFYLLILGWYALAMQFDKDTGLLRPQIWSPFDTYPMYANNKMDSLVHSYPLTQKEAVVKAQQNGWEYNPGFDGDGNTVIDDFFKMEGKTLWNMILINGRDVTGWVDRSDMKIMAAPVAGFPDKGSLSNTGNIVTASSSNFRDWRRLTGRGIFEVNEAVTRSFNKWKSMVTQILRDTAQPIIQEFSASPQATPEKLRERGAYFHYSPGETGLQRLPPASMPIEVQSNLQETRREMQKGSFNDSVYGMFDGKKPPGYTLSLLASASANQILYPYMDGKNYVFAECDSFWLSGVKKSGKVYVVKGEFIEDLTPEEIPEDVFFKVKSDIATPKDWMERATVANMMDEHVDETTLITEVYRLTDPQGIKRRKSLDRVLKHEMTQQIELAAGYYAHADYLTSRGDARQARLFKSAASQIEAQFGVPANGLPNPADASRVNRQIAEGSPEERVRIDPSVSPPEERGFTPESLRRSIGRGSLRTVPGIAQ